MEVFIIERVFKAITNLDDAQIHSLGSKIGFDGMHKVALALCGNDMNIFRALASE